jgi:hypothetical protein
MLATTAAVAGAARLGTGAAVQWLRSGQ